MIESILKIKQSDLESYLAECGLSYLKLSVSDYRIMTELFEILEPFVEITDLAQGDSYVTISMVIPAVYELINHVDSFISKSSSLQASVRPFLTALKNDLQTRFEGLNIFFTSII